MKGSNLRVPVSCTSRKINLFHPKGDRNWWVKFTPPRVLDGRRMVWPMRVVCRSTGTSELPTARRTAAAIVKSFWNGDSGDELKLRNDFPLVTELVTAYQPSGNDVRPEIATKNRSSFLLVVREGAGRASCDGLRVDVVTDELAERFLAKREARAAASDYVAQERARVSANSTLNQARSVVSPSALRFYKGMKLPDFAGFRTAKRFKVDSGHFAYQAERWAPIMGEIAAAARAELRGARPLLYRAYFLLAHLGLRPSEVWPARKSWIEGREFVVTRRPDFVPKTRRHERRVMIAPGTLRELTELTADLTPEAWLINLPTETERRDLLRYELNEWLRRWIPREASEKCSYLLRKHAGSVVADREGIEAAAAFLGDSIAVTERHYVGRLRRGRGIEAAELSVAADQACRAK